MRHIRRLWLLAMLRRRTYLIINQTYPSPRLARHLHKQATFMTMSPFLCPGVIVQYLLMKVEVCHRDQVCRTTNSLPPNTKCTLRFSANFSAGYVPAYHHPAIERLGRICIGLSESRPECHARDPGRYDARQHHATASTHCACSRIRD